jgi:hypothetical protein
VVVAAFAGKTIAIEAAVVTEMTATIDETPGSDPPHGNVTHMSGMATEMATEMATDGTAADLQGRDATKSETLAGRGGRTAAANARRKRRSPSQLQ